jgi:hypothetical protein
MYDNELDRLFTIKINFTNSCIEIENKLKSASLSNSEIKSLKKKVKKYESKITNIEKEIERLSNKENTNLNREIDTKLQKKEEKNHIINLDQYSNKSTTKTIQELSCFGDFNKNNKKCRKCIHEIKIKCLKKTDYIENKIYQQDGVLIYEISLTRIFSVMLTYHFTFVVISFAILGLGLGGIFLHFFWNKLPLERKGFNFLMIISIILSIFIPLSLVIILITPYIDNLLFYIFIMIIPFIIAGIIFAFIFKQFTQHSSKIYGIDLIGAGFGCIIVIFLFETIGGINSVIILGSLIAIGGLLFALASKKNTNLVISMIVILILSSVSIHNIEYDYLNEVPLKNSPSKELSSAIDKYGDDVKIVETRWSISGRTDLVKVTNDPDVMYIFIDGGAPTPMYKFNGNIKDSNNTAIRSLPNMFGTFFGFLFGEKDEVLIIGAGGGQDVLIALMGGSKNITAIDVNQATVDIMKDYSEFNGGLYSDINNVNVEVDEGRSFLRNSKDKYDIILLSIPVTKTSGSSSGYSLAENFLFTQEAFEDYFEHLTDKGRIIIIPHTLMEVYKLLTNALAFFEEIGISNEEAMKHIIVAGPRGNHDVLGTMYPAFIVRKVPYSQQEGKERHDVAMKVGYGHLYTPTEKLCNMVDDNLYNLASGVRNLDEFILYSNIDLNPSTDDSPFFFKNNKGLPESLKSLTLMTSLIVGGVIIIPLIYRSSIYTTQISNFDNRTINSSRKKGRNKRKEKENKSKSDNFIVLEIPKFILYFSLLGSGFMLIEVSLLHKFVLFLGKPMLSLSVTLFSLLIGSGIGSLLSNRIKFDILKKVIVISLIIGITIFAYVIFLPYIFDSFLGYQILYRAIISAIILMPLGFLLGMMFPLGMIMLERASEEDNIPWMWGINGTTSVFGSVLAISIAISIGFSYAMITGALAYFLIAMILR